MRNVIDVGKDFNRLPFGRFRIDGEYSAEAFLEDLLIPSLKDNDVITIDLSNAFGLGSSFLDGVFGVLASRMKWDVSTFEQHINIISDVVPILKSEILEYVLEAYEKLEKEEIAAPKIQKNGP